MLPEIETNPIIERLPAHLHQYIKPQNYASYTPIDQAVWRYVMRKNVSYLRQVAHDSYVDGLQQAGISIEAIPSMYGMNRILKKIGWAAVAVDGFIPPAAFMEFQAYHVLVIAEDIRLLRHIEYTPAPDIIHESAGHAPIIANPEYAEYLRRIGEIGSKAISSAWDWQVYEAIRKLSILKEQDSTPPKAIEAAEAELQTLLQQGEGKAPSEMALIRNLHWWTVEYGLIGTPEDYKIYGAGLLSSIGESKWCLTDKVKKIPYTINAAYQDYDITKPQPQLFVTPNFAHLSLVLEEFANRMALRRGGLEGVQKLVASKSLGTIELSTGLQVSGTFDRVIPNERGGVAYLHTTGSTALAHREKELIGHGKETYPNGYGTPLGKLKGINLAIEDMSPRDLEAYNIYEGEEVELAFEGGLRLKGEVITGRRNLQGKIMLISFRNCLLTYQDEVLFEPSQGVYHMAVGKKVVAAYAGPADVDSFDLITHTLSTKEKGAATPERSQKENLYGQLRALREASADASSFDALMAQALDTFPNEWLLLLELYEWAHQYHPAEAHRLLARLKEIQKAQPALAHLIEDGLGLVQETAPLQG